MGPVRRCQSTGQRGRVAIVRITHTGHTAEIEALAGREIAARDRRIDMPTDGLGSCGDTRDAALQRQFPCDHRRHVRQRRVHGIGSATDQAETVDADRDAIAKHPAVLRDAAQSAVLVTIGARQAAQRLRHVNHEFMLDDNTRVLR